MPQSLTIDPTPPKNPGLDFYHLKREGTRLVQALAGDIWTDYNEHDPGVTTLEQLCYALTELSYRAQLPVADFLTERQTGKIDAERQALYPPAEILPCNPVTLDDYRKLIVDRVPQVENAWLRCLPYGQADELGGLYEIGVYAPGLDHHCASDVVAHVAEEVRQVYASHRDLCEDVETVVVLQPLVVEVDAEVSIDDSLAAESILADLYFQLGEVLAPALRRRPLRALIERGDPPEEIFNGPLLLHGFIDNAQLQPKATSFTARQLARVMQGVPGVVGARKVKILSAGSNNEQCLTVDPWQIPQLRIHPAPPTANQPFTIRLFRNGIPLCPDPRRVERQLARLEAAARRTYPLWATYEEFFAMPEGQFRDFRAYESIQNQYPNVYGIGSYGLPAQATTVRQAQARQLKGYLLAFEQQLTDFFAQLAHTKDLFSVDPCLHQTYFFQTLADAVPNVEPLLRRRGDGTSGYLEGLAALVHSQDPFLERRNQFLDVLLALYGEQLKPSDILGGSEAETGSCSAACCASPNHEPVRSSPGQRRIDAKISLLKNMVESTAGRGRGFDQMGDLDPGNFAGMQIKCRVQLGMPPFHHPALSDTLEELGVDLVGKTSRASVGRPLGRRAAEIEHCFSPVPPATLGFAEGSCAGASAEEAALPVLLPNATGPVTLPLAGQTLTADLVCAAAQRGNLYAGSFSGETTTAVVCHTGGGEWCLLERCANPTTAWIAACTWVQSMGQLAGSLQQLYLVEHLLLRSALYSRSTAEEGFDYSFTLTAVLSGPPREIDDPAWRDFARQVVRSNTPAHLQVCYTFLDPLAMVLFESLYWRWRWALRGDDHEAKAETSAQLRDFLIAHQEPHQEQPHQEPCDRSDGGPRR